MSSPTTAPQAAGIPRWAWLVPGLPQLLVGRWGGGAFTLLVWAALASLAVLRWGRVLDAASGGWDERFAVLTLVVALATVWGWPLRNAITSSVAEGQPSERRGRALRAFMANRVAVGGLCSIGGICLIAVLAPILAPHDPALQGDLVGQSLLGPSGSNLLGTDRFARDVLSRVLYGARISLGIGLFAVGISVTLGTLIGAVAGFFGGWIDAVLMRLVDVVIAFPRLILLITVIAVFDGASLILIVTVIGLTQWPGTARLVRGDVLSIREREYVLAARALGFSNRRILFRHILPNTLVPVIIAATLGIGNVIVLEAGLSFLGIGVQPPTPSWGGMVAAGRQDLLGAWWISTFPGLAIVFTVVCFNLVGDGLRDALDPRLQS